MNNEELIRDIKAGMNIIDGDEYKDILEAITDITCDIVSKTLGPYAATSVIDDGTSTYSTKDGWSVVNRLRFGDIMENTLYNFIKDISFTLNSRVGDGTTTAIVAAKMFINIFRNWISEQKENDTEFKFIRQQDLLNEVNRAANMICEELKSDKRLKKVNSPDEIFKIANISTNGNKEVSTIIKKIYEETDNPNIHVTLNVGGETRYEVIDGYKLDTKLLNPNCHYNTSENTCVLSSKTKIVIFDHNLTYVEHFSLVQDLITSYCNTQGYNLVLMAPYYDDMLTSVAGAMIRQLVHNGQLSPFIMVQIPVANTLQKCMVNDFAMLCETEIFNYTKVRMYNQMQAALSGESGEFDEFAKLREVSEFKNPSDIIECSVGSVKKITIGKNFTLLEGFRRDTTMYINNLKMIQEQFDEEKNKAEMNNNRLTLGYADAHMRLVKFEGKSGTIFVGGDSELSCKCLKDAVDDAVLACRSAYENGYIRGMNIETISACTYLIENEENLLTKECLKMVKDAFVRVTKQIMYNKFRSEGYSYTDFENIKWGRFYPDGIIIECVKNNREFNLITEEFNDPGYSVINSVSTDIEIIRATTNILSLLLSSNQLISINKSYDKKLRIADYKEKEREQSKNVASGYIEAIAESSLGKSLARYFDSTVGLTVIGDDEMDLK